MEDQMTHAEAISKLAELAEENESLRGLLGEPLRVIAVEAIREATGCPDLIGRDGVALTDKLLKKIDALAREAGFERFSQSSAWCGYREELERFAELIAAQEREACAKVCDEGAAALNVMGERDGANGAMSCAGAIRMRSNATGKPTAANELNEGEIT